MFPRLRRRSKGNARKRMVLAGALALLCLLPVYGLASEQRAAEQVRSVTVGTWKPAQKGGVDHVKVDGEDIYFNGVKQEAKYQPGQSISIVDGKVVLVPQAEAKPQ